MPRAYASRLVKVVPHVRIHKHKMYGRDDEEAISYYHVETRRKCKTTFVGVVLLLNSTGLPVNCNISIFILLKSSSGRADSRHYRTRVDLKVTDK